MPYSSQRARLRKRGETLHLRLNFQQTPKKRPQAKPKTPVIQGIPSGTQRATVEAWHLREKERDLKNRKRLGWTDDDAKADWPHATRAHRGVKSANKSRRTERHARLERSQSRRPGCHSLPRNLSNGGHLHRPVFSLYKQLDRQREVQRSIKFREEFNCRLEDNKMVEHRDVLETMLPKEQWKNTNGKF